MNCNDVKPLLSAFMDGELDKSQRAAIDAHVNACASCAASLQELKEVRDRIRNEAPYHSAPAGLRDQVRSALRGAAYVEKTPRRIAWRAWAAVAAAILIAAAGFAALLMRAQTGRQLVAEELLSAHIRALMGHETDVASTDQHTVKPWFNGKLPFSPPVADLASYGFPLEGGRLDYADGHPLAALVYRRNLHRIDVFVWPEASGARPPARFDRNGYHEISWTKDGFAFTAISDLNPADLGKFARLLQTRQ